MIVYINGDPVTLDEFTAAYVECALWSSTDNADDSGGQPLDENYGEDDVAEETMQEMIRECAEFQADNADDLTASGLSSDRAGHDFWLTRNHHGAGFWDEGLGALGDKLTKAAHAYGSVDLYVGDDGKVYA